MPEGGDEIPLPARSPPGTPVDAQREGRAGMNVSMQDAFNLMENCGGSARQEPSSLPHTYSAERQAIAKRHRLRSRVCQDVQRAQGVLKRRKEGVDLEVPVVMVKQGRFTAGPRRSTSLR
jgi:2-polyprenyl-6-methoxyphenol hydroxylase-like FAD-dependent oxidoreductase